MSKTASSSFQTTCQKNIDLLKKNGIVYPLFSCASAEKHNINNHSIPIISLFAENPEKYPQLKRLCVQITAGDLNLSFEDQFRSCLENADNVVISGEGIPQLSEESLTKLINKIHDYGYKIKATALVRNPHSAACSAIQQTIRGGKYINYISFNDHIPTSLPFKSNLTTKSRNIKKLREVFGDSIDFHSFENACLNSCGPAGFLLEEFLHLDPSAFKYKKTNESLSNLSVRLQNEFNAINPAFINGKLNSRFRQFPALVDKRFEFSGKFLLTEAEYAVIEDFVKQEVETLNKLTGLDFAGQPVKFSKPIF